MTGALNWAACRFFRRVVSLAFLLAGLMSGPVAWSHSSSTTFIEITGPEADRVSVRLDIPLRDIALRVDFDENADSAVTWSEIKAQKNVVMPWISEGVQFRRAGQRCGLTEDNWATTNYGEEIYLSVVSQLDCPAKVIDEPLTLRYTLIFDQDALHRGLLKASLAENSYSAVLSPDRPEYRLDSQAAGFFAVFHHYLIEGVWHIWIGADHILFLVSLLLPCVFLRDPASLGCWRPSQQLRSSLLSVLAVVTAFTVAHSITLGLTVLDVIRPPAGLVEPVIAASVIIAALGNLTKTLIHLRWQIAFLFGLIHGFGFASVLADLGLPSQQLTSALLGFNIGVELGQLAIVALFFPLAWKLRATSFYRWGIVSGGSILIAAIASYWLFDRLS
ncbi:MAG: HupE/UreJ family protein [Burkholderiaceae bacterium]|jgi:hypothetical protein